MNKIILFNMVSVDGYFEGPDKNIDWHNVDSEFNDFAIEQLKKASLLIFGRVTYELMAGYWPSYNAMGDDPVVAGLMNSISKVVFSKTLHEANWNNTKLINKVTENEISTLKLENKKDIFIFGSANLASTFINLGLIDEYRLMISPVVLGKGTTLFEHSPLLKLKFQKARIFKSGNVLLYYDSVK